MMIARLSVMFVAFVTMVLVTHDAHAANRRPAIRMRAVSPAQVHVGPPMMGTTPYRYRPDGYGELYPKYYGGFHSRHLQNVGIPTGDQGLRGNGIFWTPW